MQPERQIPSHEEENLNPEDKKTITNKSTGVGSILGYEQ